MEENEIIDIYNKIKDKYEGEITREIYLLVEELSKYELYFLAKALYNKDIYLIFSQCKLVDYFSFSEINELLEKILEYNPSQKLEVRRIFRDENIIDYQIEGLTPTCTIS